MSSPAKTMHASQVSAILIGVLAALIAILIGGSIFAATQILQQSKEATHAQIDADISQGSIARLEGLKDYLENNATGISQTASLTNGLGQYNQNTIVATINGYASKAGVSITSYDFGTGTSAAATGTVNLTLGSPLQYQNFIVFLRLLERGLMPAQVTSTQVSADPSSPGLVSVSSMGIKVVQ